MKRPTDGQIQAPGAAAPAAPLAVALAALALASGCERTPTPEPEPRAAANAAANAAAARPAAHAVEYRPAGEGDVAALVAREQQEARAAGQQLLVYVGATWCEPCQRFHQAAEQGRLDGKLPPLRLLEFDLDRDGDRLKAAGYRSRMIPLFARPGPDGRSSGQQIEGSIKGDGAVDEITPRLRRLIEGSP